MSNPFHREEPPKEISEVNIVPLADVSLVLLILLMVLSPMMTQDMLKVQAAAKSKTPPAPEKEVKPRPPEMILVVAIHPEGISVGENYFTSIGAFMSHMTALLSAREDKKVFVAPESEVATGRVVNMLEMLKTCGAASVALVQSADASEAPAPEESSQTSVTVPGRSP